MLKNQLVNLLKSVVNLSLSGNVEEIKVLSDITVKDSENTIFIMGTGLNEYEEVLNDSYSIDLNTVIGITTSCGDIELHTTDGLILLSAF